MMPRIFGPRLPLVRQVNSSIGARQSFENSMLPISETDMESVVSSVQNIFGTRKGERVMRPQFGGSLSKLQFEKADEDTALLGADIIRENITNYERRVRVKSVQPTIDGRAQSIFWDVRLQLKENPSEEFTLRFQP